ncbi:MAG: PP2C family protein-serine/threonine phosphatase, partial [Planctomycetota bacterium]
PKNGTLTYACAGQPAPLLIRSDEPIKILPQPSGPFLGKRTDPSFDCKQHPLQRGDRLFWFTDTVREMPNSRGDEISIQQMVKWLGEYGCGETAKAMDAFAKHTQAWNPGLVAKQNLLFLLAELY